LLHRGEGTLLGLADLERDTRWGGGPKNSELISDQVGEGPWKGRGVPTSAHETVRNPAQISKNEMTQGEQRLKGGKEPDPKRIQNADPCQQGAQKRRGQMINK